MPRPHPSINTDDLIRLYNEGASIRTMRKHFRCRDRIIASELKALGLKTDRRKKSVDIERVVDLWNKGFNKTVIAEQLGVSQTTITNRLKERGVLPQDRRMATKTRMTRCSLEERRALCKHAQDAVRGSRKTHADLCKRAKTKAAIGKPGSIEESRLGNMLESFGLDIVYQAAIDKYNVDILIGDSIVVEVSGRPKKGPNAERIPKRIKLLLDSGFTLVLVWSNTKWHPVTINAAEYIVSLFKLASSNPSLRGKYWVIWGDGKVMTERCSYSDNLPGILTPISRGSIRS